MIYNTLDELAIKYQTDKSSKHHNFVVFYEKYLKHLRNTEINLIEVGVKHGASINMWRDYFENGTIHGADIIPGRAVLNKNIELHKVDQNSKSQLETLFRTHGPFDIIVDDGSHKMSHQQNTLEVGLKYLKPSGIFIMEDLHTSYPLYVKSHHDRYPTTLEVLETMNSEYNIIYHEHPTPNMDNHLSKTSIIMKILKNKKQCYQ